MTTKFPFLKRFLTASAIAGAMMALGSSAFAGPGTWVGTGQVNRNVWGTGTQTNLGLSPNVYNFNSNWNPGNQPSPGFGTNQNVVATFGPSSANTGSIVLGGRPNVSGLEFRNNPGVVSFGSQFSIRVGSGGILTTGTRTNAVTFTGPVQQTASSGFLTNGNQNVTLAALQANGFNTTVSGTGTGKVVINEYQNLNTGTASVTFSVNGGDVEIKKVALIEDPDTGALVPGGPNLFDVTGGNLRLSGVDASMSLVTLSLGGSLTNSGTTTVGSSAFGGGGTFRVGDGNSRYVVTGTMGLGPQLTTVASVTSGTENSQVVVSGGLSLGSGHFEIDWTNNTDLYLNGKTWNLFSAAPISGNFQDVALLLGGNTGPYAGIGEGAWADEGGVWRSDAVVTANGPQWLTFTPSTGTLMVVPEPSTLVFAGVGVAMAGWSVWKKRRLAKLAEMN